MLLTSAPTTSTTSRWVAIWRTNLPEYLLLVGIFISRMYRLAIMPLYWDEAFHVQQARLIVLGRYFSPLEFARWLNVALIAMLKPDGVEAPWVARTITVLLSMLSAAACVWLGRNLHSRRIGRLALLLYGLMPFAFFYDRQAMSDPVMAVFGTLGIMFSARMALKMRATDAIWTGLLLALATLSKFAGLLYLPVPFAAAVLLPQNNSQRWQALRLSMVQLGVFVAVMGVFYLAANNAGALAVGGVDVWRWCHSPQCFGESASGQNLDLMWDNISLYIETVRNFYTYPIWFLAIGALLVALRSHTRQILYLMLPGFALVLPYIPITDLFPPRYIVYTLVPVVVLAAITFDGLWRWLAEHPVLGSAPALSLASRSVFALIVILPALAGSARLSLLPLTSKLTPFEYSQYAAGWPSGIASQHIVDDLLAIQRVEDRRINLLVIGEPWMTMSSSWGLTHGVIEYFSDTPTQQHDIVLWLASGDPLYFIDETPVNMLPENPHDTILTLEETYEMPNSEEFPALYGSGSVARLWRVTGTTGDLSRQLNRFVFGDPATYTADYANLANQLQSSPNVPVLIYPAHQLDVLQTQVDDEAIQLHSIGDSWPFDFDAIETDLQQITAEADQIGVVFWIETLGDSQRDIERWLNTNLYPLQTQWFGPVRLVYYYTGRDAADAEIAPVGVTYGDLAELAEFKLLDPVVAPGGLLRMALNWHALTPTEVEYHVFVHVLDSTGQLVAQHDGIPQAGLTPATSWTAGQQIADQFVISLPPDLPEGQYMIRVGLYDPAAGSRLAVTDGAWAGSDSIELTQFVVQTGSE